MTAIESSEFPILAQPRRPEGRLSFRQFLGALRDNALATHKSENFSADIVTNRILWRRTFIINEPNAIRHVLLDNAANYTKSLISRRLLEPGLGRGLLTSEGENLAAASAYPGLRSAQHRDLCADHDRRHRIITRQMGRAAGAARSRCSGAMTQATLHIISRAMFSSDSEEIVEAVESGVNDYQTNVRPRLLDLLHFPEWFTNLVSPLPTRGIFDEFGRKVDRLLTERGRSPDAEPQDLQARLLAARDDESGGGMSAEELRHQVVTIFMAGHETTSQALSWSWYLLSQHPAAEARLHDELATVLGGRAPRYEDVPKLSYARMVIEESMRLYPPAHTISRSPIAPDKILGQRIPPRAEVLIVPWLLHRKPSLWENPGRFDPERFAPERAAARPRFAYIPFGGGPRICIGAAFAMAEAMVILATIAQRYRLRLKPGFPVEPQGLITLRPRYGLRMLLERRHDLKNSA